MAQLDIQESLIVEFKSDKNCLPDGDIIDAVVALLIQMVVLVFRC